MNARPNIPDHDHTANLALLKQLQAQGFKIEASSQGYLVEYSGTFIAAAGTRKIPHGRYCEANLRDNLQFALRVALNYNQSP